MMYFCGFWCGRNRAKKKTKSMNSHRNTNKYIKYKSTLFSLLIKGQSIKIFIIADLSIIILIQRLNDRL